jgi:hypothetical protein
MVCHAARIDAMTFLSIVGFALHIPLCTFSKSISPESFFSTSSEGRYSLSLFRLCFEELRKTWRDFTSSFLISQSAFFNASFCSSVRVYSSRAVSIQAVRSSSRASSLSFLSRSTP